MDEYSHLLSLNTQQTVTSASSQSTYSSGFLSFDSTTLFFFSLASPLTVSPSLPLSRKDTVEELEMAGSGRGEELVSHEEGAIFGKKYGELAPKKKPLISKDNGRAFFDSADWALGKQGASVGQKSKTMVESLRPKLQCGCCNDAASEPLINSSHQGDPLVLLGGIVLMQ